MRFEIYAVVSGLALGAKLFHAAKKFQQIYPAAVHLTQDRLSQGIFLNFGLMLLLGLGKLLLWLFCGRLREIERETLVESAKSFLADTLLFLVFYSPTIEDREVGTTWLIVAVSVAIFCKIFHIIGATRVVHMFEIGIPTGAVILRISLLLAILGSFDLFLVYTYLPVASSHSTFYSWAVFQGVMLFFSVLSTFAKLGINSADLYLEHGLSAKPAFLFFVDLAADVFQMLSYAVFLSIFMLHNPGRIPLYAISDMAQVLRQLVIRLRSFFRYRALTFNMDARFPEPTPDEITNAESCIICRDKFEEISNAKKLPCGHIFHGTCLRNWFLMQQTCPTCRAEIPEAPRPPPAPPAAAPPAPAAPRASPAASAFSSSSAQSRDDREALAAHARAMAEFYVQQLKFWEEQLQGPPAARPPVE